MPKSPKQISLLDPAFKRPSTEFGGSLLNGNNAKTKRPLDSKMPVIVTLRANSSNMRLPRIFGRIDNLVEEIVHKYGVRVYEWANVGNHIHLLIRCPKRSNWCAFIRELTGRIALLMKTLKLDRPKETIATKPNISNRFWAYKPHTRIIAGWKKAFKIAKDYVIFNQWEAEGHIRRQDFAGPRAWREFLAGLPQLE